MVAEVKAGCRGCTTKDGADDGESEQVQIAQLVITLLEKYIAGEQAEAPDSPDDGGDILILLSAKALLYALIESESSEDCTCMSTVDYARSLFEKAVSGHVGVPLADDGTAWDASAATKRLQEWAGGDKIDFGKYKRGFMWYDDKNAEKLGSYKLPFCDVIDDKLKAVPKAIYAIAAVLNGARGGVDIPDADKTKIKSIVADYYKKLGKDDPFGDKSLSLSNPEDPAKATPLDGNSKSLFSDPQALHSLKEMLQDQESKIKELNL